MERHARKVHSSYFTPRPWCHETRPESRGTGDLFHFFAFIRFFSILTSSFPFSPHFRCACTRISVWSANPAPSSRSAPSESHTHGHRPARASLVLRASELTSRARRAKAPLWSVTHGRCIRHISRLGHGAMKPGQSHAVLGIYFIFSHLFVFSAF